MIYFSVNIGIEGELTWESILRPAAPSCCFFAESKAGEPRIMEPEKCSDLQWFYLEELPENLLEDRKEALANYQNRVPYSELGW